MDAIIAYISQHWPIIGAIVAAIWAVINRKTLAPKYFGEKVFGRKERVEAMWQLIDSLKDKEVAGELEALLPAVIKEKE